MNPGEDLTAERLAERAEDLAAAFEADQELLTEALEAAAEADLGNEYIAMCDVFGLELVDPEYLTFPSISQTEEGDVCALCGLKPVDYLVHTLWHHRMQAAGRVTNWMLSMAQKETHLYGTLLRLTVVGMAEGEES